MSIIKVSTTRRIPTTSMVSMPPVPQTGGGGVLGGLFKRKLNPVEQAMNDMAAEAVLAVKQAEADALVATRTSEIERRATTMVLTQQHQQNGVERTYAKLETQGRIDTVNFILATTDAGLNAAAGLKDESLRQFGMDAIRQIAASEIGFIVND